MEERARDTDRENAVVKGGNPRAIVAGVANRRVERVAAGREVTVMKFWHPALPPLLGISLEPPFWLLGLRAWLIS